MFRRVLIVLGPGVAEAAVQSMLSMAQACHAEVVFYTGLAPAGPAASDLPDIEMSMRWASPDEARSSAERQHDRARQLAEALGLQARSLIAHASHLVGGILDAAAASQCELIQLCNQDGNAMVRLLNGNPIPGLITASPLPVLVCSSRVSACATPSPAIRRVLIVLESANSTSWTAAHGLDVVGEWGAELLFAHITPSQTVFWVDVEAMVGGASDQLSSAIRDQSHRVLGAAVTLAGQAGLHAEGVTLPPSTSAKDIAQMAVTRSCDLILIAHPHDNAVVRLINGSLVPGLISASSPPVLVCREPGRGPAGHSAWGHPHSRPLAPAATDASNSHRRDR